MKSKLYWWVIAAAFIGPGTVTTAARAGADHGFGLVWAVVVSILACMVLQEASARVSIMTGKPLAVVMGEQLGRWVMLIVALAVGIGCLAYEAGNITGATAGIVLLTGDASKTIITLLISVLAAGVLWFGTLTRISQWLGLIVFIMGLCFLVAAVVIFDDILQFVRGLIPTMPDGATLTVIALIGTTIVPYALFLGSGIAKGRQIPEMRQGILWSVAVGGVITMGILITGTAVEGGFTFQGLSDTLRTTNGTFFSHAFALGLFAAGFTSAVTAPTALGIVVESIWPETPALWIRITKIGVVAVGAAVSLTGIQPIAIIVAAQALNGLLLPLTALTVALVLMKPALRAMPYGESKVGFMVLWMSVALSFVLGFTALYRLFL